ncbi:MAG: hypothetical protein NTV86_21110 [Planctomycetota bacterium]|nr:hypothetical protein [Planctomycetota bacterium]
MSDLKEALQVEFDLVEQTLAALPAPEDLESLTLLELSGAAAFLQNIYNAFENIFKRLALAKGLKIPTGPSWHKDILQLAIDNGFISEPTAGSLIALLGFRHFVSHGYAVTLDAEQMEPLVRSMSATCAAFKRDILRQV